MKKFWILLILFISTFAKNPDPLLVIVLMVKDEAPVMEATLKPFLEAGLDSYLILDTGSTDNTVAITRKLFEDYKVKNGYIIEKPFVDFATSRNYALECTEKKFPDAAFMLMLDAEWYMHNVKDLIKFCKENINNSIKSFLIPIRDEHINFLMQRLFKIQSHIRFVGVVHEIPNERSNTKLPDNIYFESLPGRQGKEKTSKRFARDINILLKEYAKEPKNLRTLFYLGQTYACIDDWDNAIKYYKKRCEIKSGWDEDDFTAYYRLAGTYEFAKNWPMAEEYYLKAANLLPRRIEPLIHLSDYYLRQNNYLLAFLYAQRAVTMKYPKDDLIFVRKQFYDYNRYDLLGRAAYHINEFKIGKNAILKALECNPNDQQLLHYLKLYLNID